MFVASCGGGTERLGDTDSGNAAGDSSIDVPTSTGVTVLVDGLVSDEVLAAMVVEGVADERVINDAVAGVQALPEDAALVALQDLSHRFEMEAARVSGLQDAVGGEEATAAAIDGAWAQVAEQVDAIDPEVPLEPTDKPTGFAYGGQLAAAPPTAAAVGAVGVMMATMAMSVMADPVVSSSNEFTTDQYAERNDKGLSIAAGIEGAAIEMEYDGDEHGVSVKFKTSADVHACPDPTGGFTIDATVDLHTSKGAAGQNITIELKIKGQVGDDAKLAGTETETRTQWADFGGAAAGQFIDYTSTRGSDGSFAFTVNRSGGKVTDSFVSMSVLLSTIYSVMVGDRLVAAAEKAWQSGRCVRLDATPSAGPTGLQPGQTVSVLAAPRSKLDGTATGGTVTALLSAGEKSIEPSSTPLAADAEFTYTAPDAEGKGGTVSLEARSKRGVGKATIDFTTAAARTVTITGALNYNLIGMRGTANLTVTMTLAPGGEYSGTAELQMTGTMTSPATTCTSATWAESLDLMGTLSHENDQEVLVISTIGEPPRGEPVPMTCTTAGVSVPSKSPLLSSSLLGDLHVQLVDGDQPFVDSLSPATGTLSVTMS